MVWCGLCYASNMTAKLVLKLLSKEINGVNIVVLKISFCLFVETKSLQVKWLTERVWGGGGVFLTPWHTFNVSRSRCTCPWRPDRDRTRPAIIPAPRGVMVAVRLRPVSHVGDLKAGGLTGPQTGGRGWGEAAFPSSAVSPHHQHVEL